MSELIKTDVGEFFVKQTKNFVNEPPDSMWESIESQIPEYSVSIGNKLLLKYLVSGIGLSIIIIATILYYSQNNRNNPEQVLINNNVQIKNDAIKNNKIQNTKISSNKKILTTNLNVEKTSLKSAVISKLSTQKTTNKSDKIATNTLASAESEKTIKYSINATTYKNLNEIIFENSKNESVIDLKNPIPNAFGFYEVDISKLTEGTYNIWVVTNGNKTLHKTEIFK